MARSDLISATSHVPHGGDIWAPPVVSSHVPCCVVADFAVPLGTIAWLRTRYRMRVDPSFPTDIVSLE